MNGSSASRLQNIRVRRGAELEGGHDPAERRLVRRVRRGGWDGQISCQHDSKLSLGFVGAVEDGVRVCRRRVQEISYQLEALCEAVYGDLDERLPINAAGMSPWSGQSLG